MISLIILLILFYILPIFGCRHMYREFHYKKLWLKEDCRMDLIWFMPVFNIVLFLCLYSDKDIRSKRNGPKNEYLRKFLNYDL